jgi:hypothetical protein
MCSCQGPIVQVGQKSRFHEELPIPMDDQSIIQYTQTVFAWMVAVLLLIVME